MCAVARRQKDFNPRPSYEERRDGDSAGRAGRADFNPRPSYEERRKGTVTISREYISIHAPHTRSDIRLVRSTSDVE